MPLRLLRFATSQSHPEPRMFTAHDELKIVVRRGDHRRAAGMAWRRPTTWRATTASPMSRVLEKGYIGGGNTGRNTTIIRSNYLTPEGVKFYDE